MIVKLDGKPTARHCDLVARLWKRKPGEKVRIEARRGQEALDFTVTLGSKSLSGTDHLGTDMKRRIRQVATESLRARHGSELERYHKTRPATRAAFREAVGPTKAATVCVLADGLTAALGAVVDPEGHIVTKASLPSGKIHCRLTDGRELEAKVVGTSAEYDLALLKVEARGLTAVAWRTGGSPPVGSLVASVGQQDDPLALGVVSAEPRRVRGVRPGLFGPVLMHDGLVCPNDCGGPLVDTDGQVVGINIAQAHPTGTCAIPADVVRETLGTIAVAASIAEKEYKIEFRADLCGDELDKRIFGIAGDVEEHVETGPDGLCFRLLTRIHG